MTLDLGRSVLELKGVGAVRQRQLAAQGILVLGDLLLHVPFRYEDRRRLTSVAAVEEGATHTLRGALRDVRLVLRRGRRFSLVRGRLVDSTGEMAVVWFNRPYLPGQVDPEAEYLLHGTVRKRGELLELHNPSCERQERAVHTGRIVPVYASLGDLGPAMVRRLISGVLDGCTVVGEIDEPLPQELLARHGLLPIDEALEALHRPDGALPVEDLSAGETAAHRRLIYGELLEFHLRLLLARRRSTGRAKGHRVVVDERTRSRMEGLVPFRLTSAQVRVVAEIVDDLQAPPPMHRLLQGDVGSGKTAVAAVALTAVIENGLQGAFMAPTELLAEQHYATLHRLLGQRYRVELLTGSSSAADALRSRLRSGETDLVVGTHALIQEGVRFARLGLAVIDEQHRFGVDQRRRLAEKGDADLLVMTATPIPRSLTLTAYGDLDLSILDELPPGRSPVATEVVPEAEREVADRALAEELAQGGRAFVVFPLIEGSPSQSIASLQAGRQRLAGRFPRARLGTVHGQMPAGERVATMARFERGELDLLAATTVIEVGVDVPEATLMVIEGAERFGLAQLHQLRGRVGRGLGASRCIAVHGDLTDSAARRLEVFGRTTDGFEIAELDLEIRGPGELLGTRQSGLPRFHVADLRRDLQWLKRSRRDAASLGETESEETLVDLLWRLGWRQDERSDRRREASQ